MIFPNLRNTRAQMIEYWQVKWMVMWFIHCLNVLGGYLLKQSSSVNMVEMEGLMYGHPDHR